jgi:hypothetical protein
VPHELHILHSNQEIGNIFITAESLIPVEQAEPAKKELPGIDTGNGYESDIYTRRWR